MEPMLGMIFMVPWTWAPNGYQSCMGQTLTIQQYEALYSLMGVMYGGNGTTNFMLPDLQTRTAYGQGTATYNVNGNGVTLNYAMNSGSAGRQVGNAIAALNINNLPAHNHAATFTGTGGGSGTPLSVNVTVNPINVNIPALPVTVNAAPNSAATTTTLAAGSALSASPASAQSAAAIWTPSVTPSVALATGTATTSATTVTASATASATTSGGGGGITGGTVAIGTTGAGAPFTTVAPGVILNYIIAVQGLYPDRP